jgi:hypothetical protein
MSLECFSEVAQRPDGGGGFDAYFSLSYRFNGGWSSDGPLSPTTANWTLRTMFYPVNQDTGHRDKDNLSFYGEVDIFPSVLYKNLPNNQQRYEIMQRDMNNQQMRLINLHIKIEFHDAAPPGAQLYDHYVTINNHMPYQFNVILYGSGTGDTTLGSQKGCKVESCGNAGNLFTQFWGRQILPTEFCITQSGFDL